MHDVSLKIQKLEMKIKILLNVINCSFIFSQNDNQHNYEDEIFSDMRRDKQRYLEFEIT